VIRSSRTARRRRVSGFSLIELAIGLVIVATLLSALLVPLATQMDQRRVGETQKQLETAREALIGFAIANGRLPCPATDISNGIETFAPAGTRVTGECLYLNGFLPGVTLGLSPLDADGYFRDAYGTRSNRIRYAVSTENVDRWSGASCDDRGTKGTAEPRVLTKSRGMVLVGMAMIAQAADCDNSFLYICTAATTAANACNEVAGAGGAGEPANQVLSKGGAAAVIWSVGRNAADVGRTRPADELENLDLDNDRFFVARERRDTADKEFDDLVLWISPNILFARMTAAGALP